MDSDMAFFAVWAAVGVIAPFAMYVSGELSLRRIEAAEAALDREIERERLMVALLEGGALWRGERV